MCKWGCTTIHRACMIKSNERKKRKKEMYK